MVKKPPQLTVREGYPHFLDLPWSYPISEWEGRCSRLEELPRGLSRHPVVFVNYDGSLFAIKELPPGVAQKEYELLVQMEAARLPAVTAVGHGQVQLPHESLETSILITRYLDFSLPYRSLFIRSGLGRYQEHLLDAMAGLLVQLHLAGFFWGDCSLSNTLFRRNAGTLQAYLVDAETAEAHTPRLSPTLRLHDLEIMEENVDGDLNDLISSGAIADNSGFPISETGDYTRQIYQKLWEEITREEVVNPDERYRIQERIRALNKLGFSVGGLEMQATERGDQLRMRVIVTDRNFHHDQLLSLTGVHAEEMQARLMMNEIQEVKASISRDNNRSAPLSVAAYYWMEHIYLPVLEQITSCLTGVKSGVERLGSGELYCQILEHKWFLSEQAHQDVGHKAAAESYCQQFLKHHLSD